IDASRWGHRPISFGIPGDSLDRGTANSLLDAGFEIVGDGIGDLPSGLSAMERNGGSLEKGASDITLLESAEEDSLLSVYWRARVDDLRIREDKEAISWLESQEVWLTTWGEWHHHQISGNVASESIETVGNLVTVSLPEASNWAVPGSVKLQFEGGVQSVSDSLGNEIPQYSTSERNLTVGWRTLDDGVILTIGRGTELNISLENEVESIIATPLSTFNDLHHSVTVVGHHTTNLFQWTSDFQGSQLRFTWLVERPASEEIGLAIPILTIAVLVAVPVSIILVLRRDAMGANDPSS
ncbi:MAG TPA: hypothetical protein QF641_00250, partial [Candidatus Thalassarchaeaceae archaeon]|nr:hypothetical protein [Candidatus Thalassarchaeaceae archaeon]